jgi:hypothetical protein
MRYQYLFFLFLLGLSACTDAAFNDKPGAKPVAIKGNQFDEYWYQGKAEITSYYLDQARYGEIRKGHAVLVFVTEPFSKSKKVKLDNPDQTPKDAVSVLKLNATRKFNTGIYPYSIMSSIFTPVDIKKYPNTLKVSTSSQEWCGHTFMQLREQKNKYAVEIDSYFESEGDRETTVDKVLLEDEIWTRLRIDPKSLPTGTIDMLPGTVFTRLKHIEYHSFPANATMEAHRDQSDLMTYRIVYQGLNRSLSIHFQKDFPHTIDGWEETMTSGFGAGAKTLTTKASRNKSIMDAYWMHNGNDDSYLREQLGLEP